MPEPHSLHERAHVEAFRARWREATPEPTPSPDIVATLFRIYDDALLIALCELAGRGTGSIVTLDELTRWLEARARGACEIAREFLDGMGD